MSAYALNSMKYLTAGSSSLILSSKLIQALPFPAPLKSIAPLLRVATKLGSLGMVVASGFSQGAVRSLKNNHPLEFRVNWLSRVQDAIYCVESVAIPVIFSQLAVLGDLENTCLVLGAVAGLAKSYIDLSSLRERELQR